MQAAQFLKFICIFCLSHFIIVQNTFAYKPQKAAIVINADTQEVLYADAPDALRHPASLTKKMTLYLLFEALKEGTVSKQTTFTVSSLACRQIPSKLGVEAGRTVSVETIIKSLVTKSANDMAIVAAEGLAGSLPNFVKLMNQKARELGLKKTIFTNASGVPDKRQWTSARDMAILGQALYNDFPEYWDYFQLKHFSHNGTIHRTHNHLLHNYPGSDGIKTGFVNASGFNVSTSAVRYKSNGTPVRLFVVVMGGSTRHERDKRVINLMNTYFTKLGATQINPNNKEKINQVNLDDNQDHAEGDDHTTLKPLNVSLLNKARSDEEATKMLSSMMLEGLTLNTPENGNENIKNIVAKKTINSESKNKLKSRKQFKIQKIAATKKKKRRALDKKRKKNSLPT